jgi:hypothetical protein
METGVRRELHQPVRRDGVRRRHLTGRTVVSSDNEARAMLGDFDLLCDA